MRVRFFPIQTGASIVPKKWLLARGLLSAGTAPFEIGGVEVGGQAGADGQRQIAEQPFGGEPDLGWRREGDQAALGFGIGWLLLG